MLKNIFICLFLILSIYYLLSPVVGFPQNPTGSLASTEPADTESIYRKSFFTNLSRSEIIDYYEKSWGKLSVHLNLPPEDGYTVIRDQTKSSWIEEFIHPFKDSIYINGYYPTKPTEAIERNGVHYAAKITVRHIPSGIATRLTIFSGVLLSLYLLKSEIL